MVESCVSPGLTHAKAMVVTVPALSHDGKSGPRPLDPRRDIPRVIDLLQLVFGQRLDPGSHRMFGTNSGATASKPGGGLVANVTTAIVPGFVWEEDGRILGNVSLLSTRTRGRFLVANVAVHPSFRRRGIARLLMESVLDHVGTSGGNVLLLQVRKENLAAIGLYQSLGFSRIGNVTRWHSSVSRLEPVLDPASYAMAPEVRPLLARMWQNAFEFDMACVSPDLNWPEPIRANAYKKGFLRSISNFLNGRFVETWVNQGQRGELRGLVRLQGTWGGPYRLRMRVAPDWRGKLEEPLIMKCVRRLENASPRNIRLDHPEADQNARETLERAGFTQQRILTHMRYTY